MSVESVDKKRTQKDNDESCKKQKYDPAELKKIIRKQVEHYMSDENLIHDKFFHEKLSETPDNSMSMDYILSCKKIQTLSVSLDQVLEALESSSEVEIRHEADKVFIKRTRPLPPYVERRSKEDAKANKHMPSTVSSIHRVGFWLVCLNIPTDVSWSSIKEHLNSLVKPKMGKVRHVSNIENQTSYIWMKSFPGDSEFFSDLKTIILNDHSITIEILNDIPTAIKAIKNLPKIIERQRLRELNKAKIEFMHKPITIGESKFMSFSHLKKCCREILNTTPVDETVSKKSFNIIKTLLSYHPKAEQKLKDLESIKVAIRKDINSENSVKCFFVVRKDGSSEDVSILKCFDNMTQVLPKFE